MKIECRSQKKLDRTEHSSDFIKKYSTLEQIIKTFHQGFLESLTQIGDAYKIQSNLFMER